MIAEHGSVLVGKKKTPEKEQEAELKNCPRCGRKMSWLETDEGQVRPWCFWEESPALDNSYKLK